MSLILTTIILLVFGLTILIRFSDIFVSAASSLSLSLKVPKMLIALTIAAFEHVLLNLQYHLTVSSQVLVI